MIKIRIRNADHEIDVQFPISENKLYAKLAEIHAIEGKDAPQSAFVTEVYWPEELSMLKDRIANLDELNYLARRVESFDYHEYDQFLIGITKLENPTEKDLINLTFNLDHFTLCKDVSSYGKIGREYVMNTEGAVPAHDEDDPKYAAIGKELIDRGLAQITAKGLLIYNPFDELTEVYDGQTFPEYFYENTLASAEVSYNGRTELLLLPGEEIAIQKALARLGAPSDSDCEIRFCLSQGEDDAWEERIEGIIRSEGLYEANKMLRFLDTGDMDWGKLTAAVELTDAKSAANIGAVAEHLGEFAYIPDAKSESDVGHFLVDNADLSPVVGSEQDGFRPVLILQNDTGNKYSPTTIVAPITSTKPDSRMPTHVRVNVEGLVSGSVALLEQIRTIDKRRLDDYVGKLNKDMMGKVDHAIITSLGIKVMEGLLK